MAIAATTVWEINAGATVTANKSGGGFNPSNAGMLTDLTTDANTANTSAPIVSSVTYAFVAGDAGNWLYIKSGTSWTPGWYLIASVAGGKATLSAAIGSASVVQIANQVTGTAQGTYGTNTVVGCATVGTPTAGTFTIDYSQNLASVINGVADFTAVLSSTTLTSATAGFTPVMVGNIFHQTTTGTGAFGVVGWYEIATYVNATTVTLDRTPNVTAASVACTGYVGGALSMNSTLDQEITSAWVAGNVVFVKNNGTVSIGEDMTVGTSGTALLFCRMAGYNTQRGDAPTGTSRPTVNFAAFTFTQATFWAHENLIITGTSSATFVAAANGRVKNCKFINTSTTASRTGYANACSSTTNCEFVSLRGTAANILNRGSEFSYNYFHDSNIGFSSSNTNTSFSFIGNIVEGCVTTAVDIAGSLLALCDIRGNTLYGAENKLGSGIKFATGSTYMNVINNIIYGFVTGVQHVNTQSCGYDDYNDYYNNTSDVSSNDKWQKGPNDKAVNPSFTNVTQITGTGASSSTNVLTDSGKNFTTAGVTTNDYVYISAGTGTGIALNIYQITAVGTTTITLSSNITSSGAGSAISYQITLGHNFLPTSTSIGGFPGAFQAGYTTGQLKIGAVQPAAGSGGGSFTFS